MIFDGYMPENDCGVSVLSIQDTWEPKEESLDKYVSPKNKITVSGIEQFSIRLPKHKTQVINHQSSQLVMILLLTG